MEVILQSKVNFHVEEKSTTIQERERKQNLFLLERDILKRLNVPSDIFKQLIHIMHSGTKHTLTVSEDFSPQGCTQDSGGASEPQ